MSTTVISFRTKPEELAKALKGLVENNIDPSKIRTMSDIVRTTFYYGIIHLCKSPNEPADKEFVQRINQFMNQNKRIKPVGIKDLLKGGE